MLEADILHKAIENLERLTQSVIKIKERKHLNGQPWDALLEIQAGAIDGHFKVEVRKDVLPSHVASLMERIPKPEGLLIAAYISKPGKALLEKQEVNYLDIAGNCYIKNDRGIFWKISGQTTSKDTKSPKHRAFNKNGIKLIYALLLQETLLNEPYRVMAEIANISVSTVGGILKDLKTAKFILNVTEDRMTLTNKQELLSQWASAYNHKLKPKLLREKYRWAKAQQWENWKQLKLNEDTFWGGEPAADLLTHYLQPGVWTLYTNLDRKTLLRDLQLIPDATDGKVEVYSPFWKTEEMLFVNTPLNTVSPLLVYAELIGSGDDRNFATAQKIYEQYLKDIIE